MLGRTHARTHARSCTQARAEVLSARAEVKRMGEINARLRSVLDKTRMDLGAAQRHAEAVVVSDAQVGAVYIAHARTHRRARTHAHTS